MNVFYLNEASWEKDFFYYDIFFNKVFDFNIKFIYFDKNNILNLNDNMRHKYNSLIINHSIDFNSVMKIINIIKPDIIFHLSDEQGNLSEWYSLSKYCKILFKQYNNNINNNIHQIPLGYISGYIKQNSILNISYSNIISRKYICSFVGTVKQNRQYMCDLFENNFKNTKIIKTTTNWSNPNKQTIKPNELYDIYSNSIFVLIGRGNHSLDCFRIYEAIVAGAIPLIVSTKEEFDITFNYNGNIPSFIYDDTWDKVLIKCKELLKNTNKLQEIQEINKLWWCKQINSIHTKIISILSLNV